VADEQQLRAGLEALREQPDALVQIIVQQTALVEELRARVAALEARLRDLEDDNRGLRGRVDEAERVAARAAAPFRIPDAKRVVTPRRPGQRAGHRGVARPQPAQIDAHVVVPLSACPTCGGGVTGVQPVVQYIEELPVVRPYVTRLVTHVGRCAACRRPVRSTHPLQVSTATGAAGVHLGPRALGIVTELTKHAGLTLRTTARVLTRLWGLSLSPAGIAHALRRVATRVEPAYTALQQAIRGSPVVHSDETSWWVGGPGHWLWVFTTPTTTVYRIAPGRGRAIIDAALGPAFAGVLVSDCLNIYDGRGGPQQKCYAHHLKAIAQAAAQAPSPYLAACAALLREALATPAPAAPAVRARLAATAEALLAVPRPLVGEERVRRRLAKQQAHLFTFLTDARVPATNNLAERQLRPAVIARKLSCGNKTPGGAHTAEILTSLAATARQRGESFVDFISSRMALVPAR
jgi:hypothetical protein